jgi:hypothetical protein
MKWTRTDDISSKKQGWALFVNDDAQRVIFKLDDPEDAAEAYGFKFKGKKFRSDEGAIRLRQRTSRHRR